MKKLLVSLIVLVFAAVPLSAQNLVVDGSFEGIVGVDSSWTDIAGDGETFGAWTGHPSGVTHIWLYDDNGASASDGTASAHLGDGYTAASISQLVSGFTIGETYEVSLAAIAYADGTSHPGGGLKVTDLDTTDLALSLDVTFAVNPGALGDPMIYSSFLFNASSTELELSISNPTDGYAMHIDDVSIHVIPEPATMCLLGLGGLLLRRRR